MYHVRGQKFGSTIEIKQKITSVGERWSNKLIPAICQLAKETDKPPPSSDLPNGKHMLLHVLYMYDCNFTFLQSFLCTP